MITKPKLEMNEMDKGLRKEADKLFAVIKDLAPTSPPTWWVPGKDVSEYRDALEQHVAYRLEMIAERLAEGELWGASRVNRLSKKLGCGTRYIRAIIVSKAMTDYVKDLIRVRALHGVARALEGQIEKATEDTAAFKAVAQVAEVVKTGTGASASINFIDRRNGGWNDSAVSFNEAFQKRALNGVKAKLITGNESD